MDILKLKNRIETELNDDEFFRNHCFIVGGFVRDILMGFVPKDMDIVVDVEHGSLKLALKLHNIFKEETVYPRRLGKYPIWQLAFIKGEFASNLTFDNINKLFREKFVNHIEDLSGKIRNSKSSKQISINLFEFIKNI